MKIENNEYYALLENWTNALLKLQISGMNNPAFDGGLLCPACGHIHGRCADAVVPFVFMARQTGNSQYLDAAVRVVNWAEHNVLRSDGSYFNDKTHTWKGITVFSAISMGETLLNHGHFLPKNIYDNWLAIFKRQAEFVYHFFDINKPTNINYYISSSAALALAWKLTCDDKYLKKAKYWADYGVQHLDEYGLLFGESHQNDIVTEQGCHAVDLGYNVEESLPSLVIYARLTNDNEVLQKVKYSLKAHLAFLMPDGGWDNSWGCRNAKWTYWGSRTTDGCQIAYAALAKDEPIFGEAAHRNFELYKKCTSDGLLLGGPMYREAGESPCVHHTFAHTKALVSMLNMEFTRTTSLPLPRELEEPYVKSFPSIGVTLVAKGAFRATIANSDYIPFNEAVATGGAITLLWHKNYGTVCAASMNEYLMTEPFNMQFPHQQNNVFCQTPRIEHTVNGKTFTNIHDISARQQIHEGGDEIVVISEGYLCDKNREKNGRYKIRYTFKPNGLTISLYTDVSAVYHLPLVSSGFDKVTLGDGQLTIQSQQHSSLLTLQTNDDPIYVNGSLENRLLNPVGGFLSLPVYVKPRPDRELVLQLAIE